MKAGIFVGGLVLGAVLGFLTAMAEPFAFKIVMIGITSLFGAAVAVALSRGRK